MRPREAFCLLLLVAAAFVAAASFRTSLSAADVHAPATAASLDRARRQVPLLDAVRVRSDRPDALARLNAVAHASVKEVVDPKTTIRFFRKGYLLYASTEEVERIVASLKRKEVPVLPARPDMGAYFRDTRGGYVADVLVHDTDAVGALREALPDAVLDGDPVVRAAERGARDGLVRGLLVALVVAAAWGGWRRGTWFMQRALLGAVCALAAPGFVGWGIDVWTLPALLLVATTARSRPLLAGIPCLLFPSLALKRIGLVLLIGALTRWEPGVPRESGVSSRFGWVSALLLTVALAVVAVGIPIRTEAPAAVAGEPAALIVPPAEAEARAADLSERHGVVIGGAPAIPPPPDLPLRRAIDRTYRLATRLTVSAPEAQRAAFAGVAAAASRDALYLPRALRLRLRTKAGDAVIWVQDEEPLPLAAAVQSASLTRRRGAHRLGMEARWAAVAAFALLSLWFVWRRVRLVGPQLILRLLPAVGGYAVLALRADPFGHGGGLALAPVLVVAAFAPSAAFLLTVAVLAAFLPALHAPTLMAVAVTTLLLLAVEQLQGRKRKAVSGALSHHH